MEQGGVLDLEAVELGRSHLDRVRKNPSYHRSYPFSHISQF